jgi:hypothetical protein
MSGVRANPDQLLTDARKAADAYSEAYGKSEQARSNWLEAVKTHAPGENCAAGEFASRQLETDKAERELRKADLDLYKATGWGSGDKQFDATQERLNWLNDKIIPADKLAVERTASEAPKACKIGD